jgi:desulfoferrodoxin-like iron-binding protein
LPNQTGKRYACSTCGAEMLITKAGEGALSCCGEPMQLKAPGAPKVAAQAQESKGG